MVTALSFAFNEDLRGEFRALNFPVSDADYEALWQKADTDPADFSLSVTPSPLTVPRGRSVTCTVGTEALNGLTHDISFRARLVAPVEGVSLALSDRTVEPGGTTTITLTAEPDAPLVSSSIRLQAEGEYTAHAADIPVTVVTVPAISSATFAKKVFSIQGSDFGTNPTVLVNDVDHTAQVSSATDTAISAEGQKEEARPAHWPEQDRGRRFRGDGLRRVRPHPLRRWHMERRKSSLRWMPLAVFVVCLPLAAAAQEGYWNLKKYVIGPECTLMAYVYTTDDVSGEVEVSGLDSARPSTPFTFTWGDGQAEDGWFPMRHTYQDRTRNYLVRVTAHYADGTTDEAETLVLFTSPPLDPQPLPSSFSSVTIPDHPITLGSHIPGVPPPSLDLKAFDEGFFRVIPRTTAEYVMTAGASVEADLVNGDYFPAEGGFQQAVLRNPNPGGSFSIWYSSPPAFAAADDCFYGSFKWSVFVHELAHNFQLNSPADFILGGKINGAANAILTESLAYIFQCAVGYELVNDADLYGFGPETSHVIGNSTVYLFKKHTWERYNAYLSNGMPFSTWNDPSTPEDETFGTFCTVAARFLVHAEEQGLGYRVPAKRMMKLVQTFDQEALDKWDPEHDTLEGARFRSTFMVTALSYAFQEDLREEFRALNFPVSDADYEALWQKADTDPADFSLSVAPSPLTVPRGRTVTCTVGTEALEGLTHEISFRARLAAPIEGVSLALSDRTVNPGDTTTITVTAEPDAPLSTSSIRLQAEGEYTAHAADIPVTVVTVPVISSATFAKKILTIQGTDFGTGPRVLVNGADHTAQVTSATDTAITLKGKKKKLGLHAGQNTIVLIDSAGTSSVEFALIL